MAKGEERACGPRREKVDKTTCSLWADLIEGVCGVYRGVVRVGVCVLQRQ